MREIFEKLSESEDHLGTRITRLDARERALKIYKLLAHARVAISRIVLSGGGVKPAKVGTKGYKSHLKRKKRFENRLKGALRQIAASEGALRVVLVRRAIAECRLLERAREAKS